MPEERKTMTDEEKIWHLRDQLDFIAFSGCERDAEIAKEVLRKTASIAERLDMDDENGEEYCLKAGGVKVGDGKSKDNPLYRFPDGSCAYWCDRCGVFFDWSGGCCLPD